MQISPSEGSVYITYTLISLILPPPTKKTKPREKESAIKNKKQNEATDEKAEKHKYTPNYDGSRKQEDRKPPTNEN